MLDNQEPKEEFAQPFEGQATLVYVGRPQVDLSAKAAVFGMITGFRSSVKGLPNGLEIRRVLTRAPRMQEQLRAFVADMARSAFQPKLEEENFGVGINFRDAKGWGLGLYFENCTLIDSYVEMSLTMPIVEDVLIVSYGRQTDITEKLQTQVVIASPGDLPRPPNGPRRRH
mgnify:CR=1 FL=1